MARGIPPRAPRQLFDGKLEAVDNLLLATRNLRAAQASQRAKLTIPPDPSVLSSLARRYEEQTSRLGALTLQQTKDGATLAVGEWRSPVATRRNPDGTRSLVTIAPGVVGIPFVLSQHSDGRRFMTLRDAQHEYSFVEQAMDAHTPH